jgi:hypothetical protein
MRSKASISKAPITSLAETQAAFQRALLEGDDSILGDLCDTSKATRKVLFGVYRNAYVQRLIGFLRTDYALLTCYMTESAFEAMARAYIRAHPSQNPNARWYAWELPEFIARSHAGQAQPELADLARLERALGDVFDAADGTRLALTDLAALAPEKWPGLVLVPHPATRRIDLATNASAIWRALTAEVEPAPAKVLDEPEHIVVFRPEFQPRWRVMAYDEAMMWDEMAKGVTFAGLCEMLAIYGGAEMAASRAAGYLRGWIEAGMLAGPQVGT